MPDEISQIIRRLDATERNQTDLARQHTEIVQEVRELKKPLDDLRIDRETRKVRDEHLQDRLKGIEDGQRGIYRLGWWVLGVFGSSTVALITAIVKGVINVQ